ncbi:hypothetical protein ACEN85_17950, partial [Curtobacterium sp. CT11-45]
QPPPNPPSGRVWWARLCVYVTAPGAPGTGGNGSGSGSGTGSGSGALAFTGADVAPLAGAAGGLVVLGFLLIGLSRLARGLRRRGRV